MAACRGLEQAALVFFPPTRDTFLTSNAPPPPAASVPAADDGREEKEGEGEALKAHFTTLTDNLSQKIVGDALVSPQSGPQSGLGCRCLAWPRADNRTQSPFHAFGGRGRVFDDAARVVTCA